MNGINVSIIIPHYNTPELLKKLLGTIPKRPDFQVIVVDDNSTKDLDLLSAVIKEDNRCEFYKNDRGVQSAGACRNIGLEKASGKWLLFADSDDYFLSGFDRVMEEYFEAEEDIVFFAPTSIELDSGKTSLRHKDGEKSVNNFLECRNKKSDATLRYGSHGPYSKLMRSSIVFQNKVAFEEIASSNDTMFSMKTSYFAKNITACRDVIYCITTRAGSITQVQSRENFNSSLGAFIRKYRFLQDRLGKEAFQVLELDVQATKLIVKSLLFFGVSETINAVTKMKKQEIKVPSYKILNPKRIFDIAKRNIVLKKYRVKRS